MNYCLFASKRWRELLFPNGIPDVLPSGLFQWIKAFDGEMACPTHPADLEKYDVIHLNVPKNNVPYINEIVKNKPSHTKLVVNVDQAAELWQNTFEHPTVVLRELDKADMIFHVEPVGAEIISSYLKRKVHVIPHPVDVEYFFKFPKQKIGKKLIVGVIGHRYDQNYTLPFFTLNQFDCISILFGYMDRESNSIGFYYDMITNRVDFNEYCKMLATCDICIETAVTSSYGRSVVECAALGIPVVGGGNVEAMKICFPKLISSISDVARCKSMFEFLTENDNIFESIVTYGKNKAKEYSLESCKKKFIEALEE